MPALPGQPVYMHSLLTPALYFYRNFSTWPAVPTPPLELRRNISADHEGYNMRERKGVERMYFPPQHIHVVQSVIQPFASYLFTVCCHATKRSPLFICFQAFSVVLYTYSSKQLPDVGTQRMSVSRTLLVSSYHLLDLPCPQAEWALEGPFLYFAEYSFSHCILQTLV